MNNYVKIQIYNSEKFTLVSNSTAAKIHGKNVCFRSKRKNPYVCFHLNGKTVSLHRFAIQAEKGQIVDHINGNTLDNRLENLRIVSEEQNHFNHIVKPKCLSGFWGISKKKKCRLYNIMIYHNYKTKHIGYVQQPVVGALIRDNYIRKITSEKNALNFPESINEDDLRKFLINTRGKIFTVYFVKRSDGRLRKITGRYGVSKYTNGKGLNYQPDDHDLFVVFDMKSKRYKMIDLKGVLCIVYNGKRYRVRRKKISV